MNEPTNPDPATNQNPGTPVPPAPQAPDCLHCEFLKIALEYAAEHKAGQPPGGAPKTRLIDEIRRLDIPARCKAELAMLCVHGRELVRKILCFIRRHHHIAESILLGAAISWLLAYLPIIGGFLSLVSLATSVAIGMVKELREQLAALFAADIPVYA